MTTVFSEGKRETTLCTFSAAWFSIDGSLTTSTMIWPAPRTFCNDASKRGSSPGCEMGVA